MTDATAVPPPESSSTSVQPIPSLGSSMSFRPISILGRGSFGVVMHAKIEETGEDVAIKRVRYDGRLHSRELFLMRDVLSSAENPASPATPCEFCVRSKTAHVSGSVPTSSVSRYSGAATPVVRGPQTPSWSSRSDSFGSSSSHNQRPRTPVVLLRRHPNIVQLRTHYFSVEGEERYLHLVMNYLPTDLHALRQRHYKGVSLKPHSSVLVSPTVNPEGGLTGSVVEPGALFPLLWTKLILFQIARGLAFLHARHVCHRDIKPANVLVDSESGRVQLCDFGSAKQIHNQNSERNVAYVCTRSYRAPELLFGSLHYGCEVDMWSLGCIAAEFLRTDGSRVFSAATTVDQLAEIFKVLGAPSIQELHALNAQSARAMLSCAMHDPTAPESDTRTPAPDPAVPSPATDPNALLHRDYFDHYNVLKIHALAWQRVLHADAPTNGVDLVASLLCYDPAVRLTAVGVVEHSFFDDLFSHGDGNPPRLPSGKLLPVEAFMLTEAETQLYSTGLQQRMNHEVQNITAAAGRERDGRAACAHPRTRVSLP